MNVSIYRNKKIRTHVYLNILSCIGDCLLKIVIHMRYLYLLIPIILFIAISECSACSLKFISPQKGSTVDKSNITVYGTGKANPEAGDYGTVTATLNGVTFFTVSGSFSYAMSIFETRGVAVTLRPGANHIAVRLRDKKRVQNLSDVW